MFDKHIAAFSSLARLMCHAVLFMSRTQSSVCVVLLGKSPRQLEATENVRVSRRAVGAQGEVRQRTASAASARERVATYARRPVRGRSSQRWCIERCGSYCPHVFGFTKLLFGF